MEYIKLGNTGLDVSPLCLGAMGFGSPTNWIHNWILEEEESRPVIKKALDLGINFLIPPIFTRSGVVKKSWGKPYVILANEKN